MTFPLNFQNMICHIPCKLLDPPVASQPVPLTQGDHRQSVHFRHVDKDRDMPLPLCSAPGAWSSGRPVVGTHQAGDLRVENLRSKLPPPITDSSCSPEFHHWSFTLQVKQCLLSGGIFLNFRHHLERELGLVDTCCPTGEMESWLRVLSTKLGG